MAVDIVTEKLARDVAAGHNPQILEDLLAAVGGEITFGAGTATIASAGVAVKVASTTAAKGSSHKMTLATNNRMTADWKGTRLVRVQGRFDVDVASGADALVLQIVKNGATVMFETAAQTVTAATLKQFDIDVLIEMSNGDYIELYAENEDTTANVTTAAASEALDTVPAHGFLRVTG